MLNNNKTDHFILNDLASAHKPSDLLGEIV